MTDVTHHYPADVHKPQSTRSICVTIQQFDGMQTFYIEMDYDIAVEQHFMYDRPISLAVPYKEDYSYGTYPASRIHSIRKLLPDEASKTYKGV